MGSVSPVTTMPSPYRLANLAGLAIGHSILPAWSRLAGLGPVDSSPVPGPYTGGSSATPISHAIQTPPGVYSVRQLVLSLSPLLDSIVFRLGNDAPGDIPARTLLIDGLAASLATSGRESTLPLGHSDGVRGELSRQANRIAKTIVHTVREATPSPAPDDNVNIRSPCEGHTWTPAVASLLLGPRSSAELMHLYNEWLHRLILLRDALLPFENFDEVPLVASPEGRGIRAVEEQRKLFLVHCLTGNIPNAALVDLAKVFTSPGLSRGGYAFQYAQGVVLPAFISGSSSAHLLRYHATKFQCQADRLFEYEHRSYIDVPRTEVAAGEGEKGLKASRPETVEASLVFEDGSHPDARVVKLKLELGSGECVAVDLGQIARGRRYAYKPGSQGKENVTSNGSEDGVVVHRATDLLSLPSLVVSPRAKGGKQRLHVVHAANEVVKLALLGKLYPENVIIGGQGDDLEAARGAGKGFSERFVIVDDE
ncbi:hypothetical protein F5X68DRAFT_219983 [Plectosphaerella plurivora]|uniref:Uncharacterized protein n=1 Tax=Plectosphaerella plurivora TaxID=936078 RepID=A0A9P8VLC2_9PEZI|nr:hypothetical protein F5X68DRAFT_219983 [Plectosphaerella plurivora]